MKQFAKWYSYDKDNLVVDQDIYDSCDIPQKKQQTYLLLFHLTSKQLMVLKKKQKLQINFLFYL